MLQYTSIIDFKCYNKLFSLILNVITDYHQYNELMYYNNVGILYGHIL